MNSILRHKFKIIVGLGAFSVAMIFQNCGPGFQTLKMDEMSEFASSIIPFSASPDANCTTDAKYSACVFEKTPPANAINVTMIPLTIGLQFQGVSINKSSVLANNVFITDTSKQAGDVDPATLRQPASAENPYTLHRSAALYWTEKTKSLLIASGAAALAQQPINIVVDAPATGYSFLKQAIYLGKRSDGKSLALDGGVLVHLLAESYIANAGGGKILNLANDLDRHVDCRYQDKTLLEKECCSSDKGCAKAISSGMADYLVSQVFPNSTAIGEYAAQDAMGAQRCGLYRNPQANRLLTAPQAYAACSATGQTGETYAMGILFASIWYEVSLKAKSANFDINKFYFKLAEKLEPQDTFTTVLAKIQALDVAGQVAPLFVEEYDRRGLQ